MADPEEKSPNPSGDSRTSKDATGQLKPIVEDEEESTMKGNLPPAVLAIMGRRPRPEKPVPTPGVRPPHDSIPDSALPKSISTKDDDESSDSLTATAPGVARNLLPIRIPGSVEIRTVEHDELLDETEVKTVPGSVPDGLPTNTRPAAGRPPSQHDDEESNSSRVPADDEPLTTPGNEAPTIPGREAPTDVKGVPSPIEPSSIPKTHDDDDDSVTQLSPAAKPPPPRDVPPSGEDDSTEATAPPFAPPRGSGPVPANQLFGDDSDGTTRKRAAPELGQRPEDEPSFDSITNQDHSAKIRDIAAVSKPVPKLNDDGPEEEENATQVMANGPSPILSPPIQPAFPPPPGPYKKPRKPTLHGIAPPAELLPTSRPENAPAIATVGATSSEPPKAQESESGLKIAPPNALATTERANPAVLGNVVTTAPHLGALLAAPPGAHAVVPPDGTPLPPPGSLSGGMLSVSAVPTTTRDNRPLGADGAALPISAKMGAIGAVLVPDGTPLPAPTPHAVYNNGPPSVHRVSLEPPPHSFVPPSLGASVPGTLPHHEADLGAKVPRWGIIVGAVAAACITIPILLYVVLNRPPEPVVVLPAELVPLPVKRLDAVRTKHDRSAPTTPSSGKKPDPKRR